MASAAWFPDIATMSVGSEQQASSASCAATELEARIQELVSSGEVSARDAKLQLLLLSHGKESSIDSVGVWLRDRGAVQAAFRTDGASSGTTLLMRSVSGELEADVKLEGEYVGQNGFFSNFLSRHFGSTGSCIIVSKRWFTFCPTLLRFLYSPQPLFVEQLMYQQTLESALVLHHCALYFLATGEFFLELFHIVSSRRSMLIKTPDEQGMFFPMDAGGEAFDIYHLPLTGVLMWLVALKVPGPDAMKVLRQSGCFGARPASSDSSDLKAISEQLTDVLRTLFSPTDEYWQSVINGGSGMGLSEQAETEEKGRRQENLEHLHELALELQEEFAKDEVLDILVASAPADGDGDTALAGQASDSRNCKSVDGACHYEAGVSSLSMEIEFNEYLDGAHGFSLLCITLGMKPGIEFDSLALAFFCGSKDAQSLSSRQEFFRALANQCCNSVDQLQALRPAMVRRVCCPDGALEFWDWLFHSLSSMAPSGGGPGACKKPRLQERSVMPITVAVPALRAAAPCLGSPPLLPMLVQFFLRHGQQRRCISFDTWHMTRIFLQRFSNVEALEAYDESDGEFPSFFDSFVEEVREECLRIEIGNEIEVQEESSESELAPAQIV